jgi:hypothetical protein
MKTQNIILLLLLIGCCGVRAQTTNTGAQTNAIQNPRGAAPSDKKLPTWYVFKIKAFRKVTYSDDRTSAIVEGVTIKDKEFKVKMVWDERFDGAHQKALDQWLKRSKEQFEAGIPYVIAGEVLSWDPLTVKPDTMAPHAPNFGAPPENVY